MTVRSRLGRCSGVAAVPAAVVLVAGMTVGAAAQTGVGRAVPGQGAQAQPAQPPSARAAAPVDLTGTWVSVVTEDWRWRMMTPPKGDVQSVPLNPEGIRVSNAWDPAREGACEAYGAPALLRMPGRVRISWENDTTLKLETDAGTQTRRFHFGTAPRAGGPSLQGHSTAEWERAAAGAGGFDGLGRGGGAPTKPKWLPLKVVTTALRPGWLRTNGVPYSANATVTEHFVRFTLPDGTDWFTVMTVVDDPTYLTQPFITSTNFKREDDNTKWHPTRCK